MITTITEPTFTIFWIPLGDKGRRNDARAKRQIAHTGLKRIAAEAYLETFNMHMFKEGWRAEMVEESVVMLEE